MAIRSEELYNGNVSGEVCVAAGIVSEEVRFTALISCRTNGSDVASKLSDFESRHLSKDTAIRWLSYSENQSGMLQNVLPERLRSSWEPNTISSTGRSTNRWFYS